MKIVTTTSYKCEYCDRSYDSKEGALACEKKHTTNLPKVNVGDVVFLNHPNRPGPNVVTGLHPKGSVLENSVQIQRPDKTAKRFSEALAKSTAIRVRLVDITRVIPADEVEGVVAESEFILDHISNDTLLSVHKNSFLNFQPADKDAFAEVVVKIPLPKEKE